MFRTIFSKLLAIFIIVFLIAFSITGVMLSFFLNSYFTDERARALETTGSQVNNAFGTYLENLDYTNSLNNKILEKLFNNSIVLLGELSNSIIWFVDESGHVMFESVGMPQTIIDKYTDNTMKMKIPESKNFSKLVSEVTTIKEVGDFNGFFKDASFKEAGDLWLTVGSSFQYRDDDGSNVMIVIYLHTPVKELKEARYAVFKYFLGSVGVAVVIAFLFMYAFSLRLSRPLKQIKNAAARIADGEFEKRLDIKSRDEIGDLARTFNQMAVALQNLEEMRRGFIANVSHELRTPMTSIRGFVEGILDGTIPPDRQNHYLSIVRDETNRLNRLVNDLLDLAKMEAGEMTLNIMTWDINELIRKCVIKLENFLLEKNLTVVADFEEEELLVKADVDAIERVIYNLMHNAIKFTQSGGKIILMTRIQKDRIAVTIEDNGIGIDKNELDMIWDRFYKTDKSRSRDKMGTGLGLAIVKNIVNEHGQKIWVESSSGEGTRFTFTLSRANEETKMQTQEITN